MKPLKAQEREEDVSLGISKRETITTYFFSKSYFD